MKTLVQKATMMVIATAVALGLFLGIVAALGWIVEFTCATNERFAVGLSILLAIVWNMLKDEIGL
jgi:hypothetical protein